MTVQPDMRAVGPRDRTLDEGFDVGFEDLPDGRLLQLNPDYFGRVDVLLDILLAHDLVPVLAPVFQGFGWKGLDVAGKAVPPEDYARYCRYLVARYGARPVVYLVGADGSGEEPQVAAGGEEVHAWDAYGQPTGIHYQPHAATRPPGRRLAGLPVLPDGSRRRAHPGPRGGHAAQHPGQGGAEPGADVREHPRARPRRGWWQGHEAWSNLCSGATMGVGYGAASLWQWRLHADEPGHSRLLPGPGRGLARGPGLRGLVVRRRRSARIMRDLPLLDMAPDWTRLLGSRVLSATDEFVLLYRESGRLFAMTDKTSHPTSPSSTPARARSSRSWCSTRAGQLLGEDPGEPRVYVFTRHPIDRT